MFRKTGEISEKELLDYSRRHYENFPVISFLIPRKLRVDVSAIYWFARKADDIADEGIRTPEERIIALDGFEAEFNSSIKGIYSSSFIQILHNTILKKGLTHYYFNDLISAFRQDVIKTRYRDYNELLDYCRRSANPVGRLMLELFGIKEPDAYEYSDAVCTALQLTNFYQDAGIDIKKGRIYFPTDEMRAFNIEEKSFELMEINDNFRKMVKFNIERTLKLFNIGKKLLGFLPGRFRLEIDWTIRGGLKILDKIKENNYNVFIRPKLNKADAAGILIKSLIK